MKRSTAFKPSYRAKLRQSNIRLRRRRLRRDSCRLHLRDKSSSITRRRISGEKMNKVLKILLISSVTFSLFSGPNEDLLDAAKSGNSVGVEAAIAAGADINTNIYGTAALIVAAINGHTDIVRLLLDKGADINATDVSS